MNAENCCVEGSGKGVGYKDNFSVSKFGKMEQAGDLLGDNEGTGQGLGSNINSVLPSSFPELA